MKLHAGNVVSSGHRLANGRTRLRSISRALPRRFWVELISGSFLGLLVIATAAWHDWIELVFGVDPDHGSGAVEWVFVGVLIVSTLVLLTLARRNWRLTAHRLVLQAS
jgi:hypothetical protein